MDCTEQTGWIDDEWAGIDLGDRRLNKRCKHILERFAADPQASINGACHGWAETHAAYQFFDRDAVDEHQVLAPHRRATLERMKSHPVVLLVQDTTKLDYTRIKKKLAGAGPLDKEYRRGFYDHVQVAFTPQRLCLGVVGMCLGARDDETFDTCKQRKYTPLEEKESRRWLDGYRNACRIAACRKSRSMSSWFRRKPPGGRRTARVAAVDQFADRPLRRRGAGDRVLRLPLADRGLFSSFQDRLQSGRNPTGKGRATAAVPGVVRNRGLAGAVGDDAWPRSPGPALQRLVCRRGMEIGLADLCR